MLRPEVVAKIKYETSDAFRLDESKRPKDDVPLQNSENSTSIDDAILAMNLNNMLRFTQSILHFYILFSYEYIWSQKQIFKNILVNF